MPAPWPEAARALRRDPVAMKFKFIAVEGPIGVGKSSLVDILASRFDAQKIREDTNNPFLRDFYLDRPGSAFQSAVMIGTLPTAQPPPKL